MRPVLRTQTGGRRSATGAPESGLPPLFGHFSERDVQPVSDPPEPGPAPQPPDEPPPFADAPPPPPPIDEPADSPPSVSGQAGPGEPPGPSGPQGSGDASPNRTRLITAVVLAVALAASVFVLVGSRGDDGDGEAAAGEIFLEPASAVGADPFTPDVAGEVFVPATTVPVPATTAPPSGQVAVLSASGATPGLYGGTRDDSRCDRAQMVGFLEQDQTKAAAWAGAQGIPVQELRSYIESLTPVQLRADTRVTNHGFTDRQASPKQSVLQSGTSVLVDDTGVPRARCACGNPLVEAEPVAGTPSYSGEAWDGFEPARIVVVQSAPPMGELTVADLNTGEGFTRPVGTAGEADTDAPAGTDIANPLGGASAVTTPPTSETSDPGPSSGDTASFAGEAEATDEVQQAAAAEGAEVTLAESSVELRFEPNGTLFGAFTALFVTTEQGCAYDTAFTGSFTGTHDGTTFGGDWTGTLQEQEASGDCEGLLTGTEDISGSATGTVDPAAARASGTIDLGGLPLIRFELEG